MRKHLKALSIEVLSEEVIRADIKDNGFEVQSSVRTIHTHGLVIASGTRAKRLTSIEIPDTLRHRILYEVYPIRKISGRRVVIIGSGDAALDYALTLQERNHVTILNRGKTWKCLGLLWRRAQACERILCADTAEVRQILPGTSGDILLRTTARRGPEDIQTDYVIIAVGRQPETSFVSPRLADMTGQKSTEGLLHLAGDVRGDRMRQVAIAVGDGITAAMRFASVGR
jgi:thioredoxin reductase